ncbi:HAMP domain-containing sensor histidine kinase [Bacteroides zhangwenhongii]|uniref:histidine kinase n=2 Tax=Bacteroides TaxID=816 RepID=A0ABT5H6N9_9BACE|nr:HAMP domain-containing sensor histidine kinase [Bacteroides zhangwenhongii]MDC7136149.1 HAMP domain-containing sensor histidine kinase [Bacteroides zhangwenhongii]OKZ24847.1 MAG: histidine kinase [Bacteroides finegoldii]
MKRIALLLFVLCCSLNGKASTYTSASDSLLKVLQTIPHDTIRLNIISQIIRIEQNNSRCIQYADTLMKEALLLHNDKYAGMSAYYHILYYYNHNDQDSVSKWLNIMRPYVKKSELWDYFFEAKRFQLNLYTNSRQYELAISEAQRMKQQSIQINNKRGIIAAYQCLSNAYVGSQRWDEGIKALEEAYRMLTAKDHPVDRISVLSQLISVTKARKDNQKLLKYIQEQENILHKHIAENPSLKEGFTDVYLFNELFYCYYYLNINAPEQAYPHLIKSKEYLNKNTYFTYRILYFDTLAQYNRTIGKYQQALNYIDTTLIMLKKDFPNDYAEQLLEKARIWKQVGQNEKAILFYEQALSLKDSVTTELSNTQMKQIKKKYNIEKNELEQEKRNNRTQLLYLVFIFVILILLFIFMARLFMIRKALKHSECEIRKATETVRQTNEMKNRFLSKMSYNIRIPLNNVVGFSQLIACESNIDKEARQEYTNIIHQSSEKLMKLVNDVLDLSRLEAQMMKFQVQDYDVIELCKEVCYMARVQNEQTGINVDFSTKIDSPIIIHTDTRRLTQALLSALVYPQEHRQERYIRFILSREKDVLHFQISNSPLADPAFVSQETIIRHDINLLLLQHFGGDYFVNQETPENPEIVFIYPISSESK